MSAETCRDEGVIHEDFQAKKVWAEGSAIAKAPRQGHARGVQGSQTTGARWMKNGSR